MTMGTATKEFKKPLATVILDYLLTANLSELVAANKVIVGEIKRKQRVENQKALADFRPNDKVQLKEEWGRPNLPGGAVGIVVRLGFKNITVDFGVYRSFRVPAGCLEAAPANASFVPKANALTPPRRRMPRTDLNEQETPPEMA
jgi:hypothetical protein